MNSQEEVITPYELNLYPDSNCLTHMTLKLPRQIAETFADEMLKGKNIDELTSKELHTAITMTVAKVFYLGAEQERKLVDRAVEGLIQTSGIESHDGLRRYDESLGSLCRHALSYLRESVKRDNAHLGRMSQRKSSLESAIRMTQLAWDRCFQENSTPK